MQEKLIHLIQRALDGLGVPKDMVEIKLDHASDFKFGDYTTNIAMMLAKSMGDSMRNPLELAKKIVTEIEKQIELTKNDQIEKVEAVTPGFINFFLSKKAFVATIQEILEKKVWYGKNTKLWNKRMMFEYTDPNPFKQFHIGHLMSNAIGESLSRLYEFHDAKVTRATYGGDVGLHVAKTLWGVIKLKSEFPQGGDEKAEISFLGKAYVAGAAAYETDSEAQKEIQDINKKVFEKSDPELDELYTWGKKVSVKHFHDIYEKLGSHFDYQFFESEVADDGVEIVQTFLAQGVFEKSDGAIIFPGEKYGLHNRVFINSQGLPTYEAKELGLTKKKFELHDFDDSIIVTANEQDDYFKVIIKVLEFIYPEIARRTKHLSHGMMRFAEGKMSSRLGNVVTGEAFLEDVEKIVLEKMKGRDMNDAEKEHIAQEVAVAAIKYSVLRQSIGKDIMFDQEKSLSFEGDSGPYLQYAYVRTKSILAKAHTEGVNLSTVTKNPEVLTLERMLMRFPEIVERAALEYAPTYVATYLIQLAGEYNSYYASTKIIDAKDPDSPYKIAITEAVSWVLKNGLYLLGIQAPERM